MSFGCCVNHAGMSLPRELFLKSMMIYSTCQTMFFDYLIITSNTTQRLQISHAACKKYTRTKLVKQDKCTFYRLIYII